MFTTETTIFSLLDLSPQKYKILQFKDNFSVLWVISLMENMKLRKQRQLFKSSDEKNIYNELPYIRRTKHYLIAPVSYRMYVGA